MCVCACVCAQWHVAFAQAVEENAGDIMLLFLGNGLIETLQPLEGEDCVERCGTSSSQR